MQKIKPQHSFYLLFRVLRYGPYIAGAACVILDTGRTKLFLALILIGGPLVLAFMGNAALEPDFALEAAGLRGYLVRWIPSPYYSAICWTGAVVLVWALWRRVLCAWNGVPRFRYNESGFAGLARKLGFLSAFQPVDCGWSDVISIKRVSVWPQIVPFVLYLRCRAEHAAGFGLTATFIFVPWEVARSDMIAFFTMLDRKRPDLKDQLHAVFPALAERREATSSASYGSSARRVTARPLHPGNPTEQTGGGDRRQRQFGRRGAGK